MSLHKNNYLKKAVNIFAAEARNGMQGYVIEIFDDNGNIISGISGSVANPNALVKARFHIGRIYLPNVQYFSVVSRERIAELASETGKNIEERVDGAISIANGTSDFLRPLRMDERNYLQRELGVVFEK